jgi:hypothetical protein
MDTQTSAFFYLSEDEIHEIALKLDITNISYYCLSHSKFNHSICYNNDFWRKKFLIDFGKPDYDFVDDWKSLYKNYGTVYSFDANDRGQLGLTMNIQPKIPNFKLKAINAARSIMVAVDFNDNIWMLENWSYKLFKPTNLHHKAKCVAAGNKHVLAIDFNNHLWVNLKTLSYSLGDLVVILVVN